MYTTDGTTCIECQAGRAPTHRGDGCQCDKGQYDKTNGLIICFGAAGYREDEAWSHVAEQSNDPLCEPSHLAALTVPIKVTLEYLALEGVGAQLPVQVGSRLLEPAVLSSSVRFTKMLAWLRACQYKHMRGTSLSRLVLGHRPII